jgi:hypothetical protein
VWAAGADPIDLTATWPVALVTRIVTSFSEPGARVVLVQSPTQCARLALDAAGAESCRDCSADTEADRVLVEALRVVEDLGRTVRVEHIPIDQGAPGPASRPFWADLVSGSGPAPATVPIVPASAIEVHTHDVGNVRDAGADLLVACLPPHHSGDHSADLVALLATGLLRVGGILVVLTHCDWTSGELTDPTGAIVTAGQNADLLYLQHIVALHAPVRDGHFHLTDTPPADHCDEMRAGDEQARARHRAEVRGLPAPHRRIHSDVLVFAQPHDHQPTRALQDGYGR